AGMPLEIAIAEIDTFESHRRRCYAGVVGARIDGDFHAFVNLRCAFAAHADFQKSHGWLYNLYAGGGLMPDSEEEAEWNETVAKTVILSTIIKCDNPSAKEYDLRDAVFTPYNHEPPLL
ncbi:MAG: chorismate-binding protein, partial [Duncaniella sp.]|nr:chorismate-binding protein [Duncaniella sp.]